MLKITLKRMALKSASPRLSPFVVLYSHLLGEGWGLRTKECFHATSSLRGLVKGKMSSNYFIALSSYIVF
jgi:hypothetical protein